MVNSVELAQERVRIRVTEGGHHIDSDVIKRRYYRGIKNLFEIFLPVVDGLFIFDNSFGNHELIAQKTIDGSFTIIDKHKFAGLKSSYDNSQETN